MPATSAPVVVVAPVEPPPDCAVLACVALTFDDGPGPYTSALLDVLDDKQAKATFFVLGSNVTRNRELVARAAASGHVIGNHSWSHKNLVKTDSGTITVELESTSTEVFDITGAYPDLMRPPYGTVNDAVVSAASVHDIALVLWDIDTEDWKNRDPQVTTARALEATSGSIILMHDIHESTLIAVPGIVDGLRAAGYTLVTVPDLLGSVHPGQVYWNRSDEVGSTEAHPYDPSDNQICWAPEPVSTPPESRPEP
ncbi:MAG: polysaccharide deacetylase family protein [Micrococcales bacterium]|nr:polysaccharide deacetylase family protein [Micrococcales bacterium]